MGGGDDERDNTFGGASGGSALGERKGVHHGDGPSLPRRGQPGQHVAHPPRRDDQLGGSHRRWRVHRRLQFRSTPPLRAPPGSPARAHLLEHRGTAVPLLPALVLPGPPPGDRLLRPPPRLPFPARLRLGRPPGGEPAAPLLPDGLLGCDRAAVPAELRLAGHASGAQLGGKVVPPPGPHAGLGDGAGEGRRGSC